MGPNAARSRWILAVASAATLSVIGACNSLPLVGGSRGDQLTAAMTDIREGTSDRLILSPERLSPFATSADGSTAPQVRSRGEHDAAWLEALVSSGVVDEVCNAARSCEPQPGALMVTLSGPYDGRAGAFVDGTIVRLLGSGPNAVAETRFVRYQIQREPAGWRVVASIPLWEEVG